MAKSIHVKRVSLNKQQSCLGLDKDQSAVIGRYAALVTADEAIDVTFTNLTASNAISNNFLTPKESISFVEEYQNCGENPDCQNFVESKWEPKVKQRLEEYQNAINEYKSGSPEKLEKLHIADRLKWTIEGYESYEKNPEDFILVPNKKSIYHTFVVEDDGSVTNVLTEERNYTKWLHPVAKYEVVLDENNNIVRDPVNAGTYNYFNPETGGFDHPFISNDAEHTNLDVVPYFLLGNNNGDTTSLGQRLFRNMFWLNAKD